MPSTSSTPSMTSHTVMGSWSPLIISRTITLEKVAVGPMSSRSPFKIVEEPTTRISRLLPSKFRVLSRFEISFSGQAGQCRMYIWTYTTVRGTSSFEQNYFLMYISYSLTATAPSRTTPLYTRRHGITNRMTGGGTGRCLQTTEAGRMGEGWSDALAEWTE